MSNKSKGFQVSYPTITIHAVSRGPKGPAIYCQLDESTGYNPTTDADADGVTYDMRELTIYPKDPDSGSSVCILSRRKPLLSRLVEKIFESLSSCAALHPDPDLSEDDDLDDAFVAENPEGMIGRKKLICADGHSSLRTFHRRRWTRIERGWEGAQ